MAARQDEPGSDLPAPPFANPEEEAFWGKVSAQVARRRRVKHARNQRIATTALFLLIALPGALHFAQRDEFVPLAYRGPREEFIGVGLVETKGRGGGTGGYGSSMGDLGGKHEGAGEVVLAHDKATVSGPLDPALIREVIQRNRAQLRFCYESLLVRHPALAGEVTVGFVLLADGTVAHASVTHSTVNNPELEACVVGRVRRWFFPKPKDGDPVKVTYPFRFQVTAE